jgi:hypothetical protein
MQHDQTGGKTMNRSAIPVLVLTVFVSITSALSGCGSEEQSRPESVNTDATVSPEAKDPVVSSVDPCSLLSIEELRTALPELNGVGQQDPANHMCIYSGIFVKTGPVTREELELEHDLFGLAPRAIEIADAEWAVLRIDTSEGKAVAVADALVGDLAGDALEQSDEEGVTTIFDVIASGPSGTVTLAPTGTSNPPLDSARHEALVRLLELAYSRL